jgi:hypothetical protein
MKKTNKVHPITAFRKANEARQTVVKKSLKKAQDGIETNDMMINKPDSTGGYKNTGNLLASLAGSMRPDIDLLREKSKEAVRANLSKAYNDATKKYVNPETEAVNKLYPNYQIPSQKKGGAIKRKK